MLAILVAALLVNSGLVGSRRTDERLLFSVLGRSPFSDSIFTIGTDGSDLRPLLTAEPGKSYLYASGTTLSGRMTVVVHEATGRGIADHLYLFYPKNKKWELVDTGDELPGRGVESPDGTQIVFGAAPKSAPWRYRIYLKNFTTGAAKYITSGEDRSQHGFPIWSPDSKEISFLQVRYQAGTAVATLIRIRPDGTSPKVTLTESDGVRAVAYSPDGKRMCVLTNRGVEILNLESMTREVALPSAKLPNRQFQLGLVTWSNSNSLAFVVQNGTNKQWELWTVGIDGSNPRCVYTLGEGVVGGIFFVRE
ncbi:MAG TPA: hypothetical protein VOA88_11070 [Candidatus Dormibacteraeota bacterium]|nr:hypothetical protein [Candidatus Dormibacteraeota bacterium]